MRTGIRFAMGRPAIGCVVIGWLALVLAGCAGEAGDTGSPIAPPSADGVARPAAGADFDYQLGGDYEPPVEVDVVARDSTSEPVPGLYNICYVNGFQTQPGEGANWLDENPELVLHDGAGAPVADPGWPDEFLLDTSTAEKRSGIAERLAAVLSACGEKGFDAVEIDNLDSWTRSDGALTIDDNIAMAIAYAERAHSLGLAIAQKNGAGSSLRFRDEVGFDFVVSEQCMRYEECDDYVDVYDGLVFDIEYPADDSSADETTSDFAEACAAPGRPASMILRDIDLAPVGEPGYLRESC